MSSGWFACVALLTAWVAAGPAAAEPVEDWLSLAPADARLYVEFRDLTRLRDDFRRLNIWHTLADLGAGAPATSQAASQPRMEQWLGMSREEAVTRLLGRRTAIIADSLAQWREGIVFAEVAAPGEVDEWLTRWAARRIAIFGDAAIYTLQNAGGVRLAVRRTLLVFAPAAGNDRQWHAVTDLLAGRGGASLAALPELRALRERLPADGDGLLALRTPLDGGAWLAATMRSRRSVLEIDVEWQESVQTPPAGTRHRLLAAVPDDALACWSGAFDAAAWLRDRPNGPEQALWSAAFETLRAITGTAVLSDESLGRVGPGVAVVLQREDAHADAGYVVPVLSLLVESKDPPRTADDLGRLLSIVVALVNTQMRRFGHDAAPLAVEEVAQGGVTLRRIPIGRALAVYTSCPYLARIELAWAPGDGRVVLSTSAEAALRLCEGPRPASRPGEAAASASAPARPTPPPDATQWFHARGTEVSNMIQSWLRFAMQQSPMAVRSSWWKQQARRRARESQRLGVTLRGDVLDGRPVARVLEVSPDSPAAGALRPADVIVSAEGRELSEDRPAREVMEKFRQRESSTRFTVEVMRDGRRQALNIDMPQYADEPAAGFSPQRALFPFVAIGRPMSELTVTFRDVAPRSRSAHIAIRWRPPFSRPATAPAKPR